LGKSALAEWQGNSVVRQQHQAKFFVNVGFNAKGRGSRGNRTNYVTSKQYYATSREKKTRSWHKKRVQKGYNLRGVKK
jgi:hypothetical protein